LVFGETSLKVEATNRKSASFKVTNSVIFSSHASDRLLKMILRP
jgi:hypothetical protein